MVAKSRERTSHPAISGRAGSALGVPCCAGSRLPPPLRQRPIVIGTRTKTHHRRGACVGAFMLRVLVVLLTNVGMHCSTWELSILLCLLFQFGFLFFVRDSLSMPIQLSENELRRVPSLQLAIPLVRRVCPCPQFHLPAVGECRL